MRVHFFLSIMTEWQILVDTCIKCKTADLYVLLAICWWRAAAGRQAVPVLRGYP